jgi:hypothetical protein
MDIEGWLRSLGLERYEAAFRENEIDEAVPPNLTAEDLKDLGVGIVGHRPLCGMISQYNVAGEPQGPRNLILAVGKSLRLEGFIVANHFNLLPEFQKDMSG